MIIAPLSYKRNKSKSKAYFKEQIEKLIFSFSNKSEEFIQINQLSEDTGLEKRRLYDFMNVLAACGMCSKSDTHSYKWMGINSTKKVLIQIFSQYFLQKQQQSLKNLFVLKGSPTIGLVTTSFLATYLIFVKQVMTIRNISIILSPDLQSSRAILRRLYLVSYLLECAGLLIRTSNPGEYQLIYDINNLVKEALSNMAYHNMFPPDFIEYQMNNFSDQYLQSLALNGQLTMNHLLEDN